MSPHRPRKLDAKAEGRGTVQARGPTIPESPMEKFKSLTRRLLQVPKAEVQERQTSHIADMSRRRIPKD
jgi:hypothetical protein